jgi:hypothetical protein
MVNGPIGRRHGRIFGRGAPSRTPAPLSKQGSTTITRGVGAGVAAVEERHDEVHVMRRLEPAQSPRHTALRDQLNARRSGFLFARGGVVTGTAGGAVSARVDGTLDGTSHPDLRARVAVDL